MTELIEWNEWKPETFERARKADKLVLLDLSAVWCHWCHVMDETSYSDKGCAQVINEQFVPVKVWLDQRPDIGERYNLGGYPTTALLTPDGKMVGGGTYIPPRQLAPYLASVNEEWKNNRAELLARAATRVEEPIPFRELPGQLEKSAPEQIANLLKADFDEAHGGFGDQPKFPVPETIQFCLLHYHVAKDRQALAMAEKTLQGITGIFDETAGGFYRYSMNREWSVPHFEKLLELNAELLHCYLDAHLVTQRPDFKAIAERTVAYVDKTLSDPQGFFYGSQDADEAYYHAAPDDRARHKAPFVDRTLYVDANAAMASSYLKAGVLLDRKELVDRGLRCLDFLLAHCFDLKKGACHYVDSLRPQKYGLLMDNAALANALIEGYEYSGNPLYLYKAREALEFLVQNFWNAKRNAFTDALPEKKAIGFLNESLAPIKENLLAATALTRHAAILGETKYKEIAERVLKTFSLTYHEHGLYASLYGLALYKFLNPVVVSFYSAKVDEQALADARACMKVFEPRRCVKYGSEVRHGQRAYLACSNKKCTPMLASLEEVLGELRDDDHR
ncbi:MAG TPA: thioredoxin domain-containing protein [Candidatus Diapherotrites archaeon]|uniref:Thioredoxin domain-containing protein n=1 Tax=Candidatus Iainarchaeum sp. TaxID=3101447 RepID=A0A7J4JIP2_9ARCH|nr:thioredoxin domain-containing protein [Candidatus Diapherotrites archaeon]